MTSFSSGCGGRADGRGSESSSSPEAGPFRWALEDPFPPGSAPQGFPSLLQFRAFSPTSSPFLSGRTEARLRREIMGQSSLVGIKKEKNK